VKDVRDLQQLVERRLKELGGPRGPMSSRHAASRSEGKVSYETLRLLRIGQHSGSISREVAEGLALCLDLPLETVLGAAGQRIPLGPFVLPPRAETLTKSERAAVLSVVDAILDAADQIREDDEEEESPLRAVAKGGRRPGGTTSGRRLASATARRVRKGKDPLR